MTDNDISPLDEIKDDCLHLLMTAACLRHLSETYDPNAGTRLDLHMAMIQLRAIENDIVVRVCRFDDERANQVSLRYVLKTVRAGMEDGKLKAIDRRLKGFRQTINPIKAGKRNRHIGHLAAGVTQPHDSLALTNPTAVVAWCWEPVRIVDLLAQARCEYTLESTRGELLDLRAYCGVDIEAFPPIDQCIARS